MSVIDALTAPLQRHRNVPKRNRDSLITGVILAFAERLLLANNGHERASRLRPLAEPAEIDHVVASLCSPLASAINGAAPRAYGGMVRSLF